MRKHLINPLVGTPCIENLEPPKDAHGYYVLIEEI